MIYFIFLTLGCLSGFVLFTKIRINTANAPLTHNSKVSVIIPARNEEQNLPFLLKSLTSQTYLPYEIIVVDDFSNDNTKNIALDFGVKVIDNSELPQGWTGKSWAVWNGYKESSGDILVFFDADVRLAPNALQALLKARERSGGAISVVPYHHTEKFYERFSLITNILGAFSFFSPFERKSKVKGLYGSCIVAKRDDYEKIGGHGSVNSDIMDDINIGKKFSNAGIPVDVFLGYDLVSFRMYPGGIMSEIEGFGKGAILGAASLRPVTVLFIVLWLIGLIASEFATPFLVIFKSPIAIYFLIGYLLYTIQIIYFIRYIGNFGVIMPVLHLLSTLFFLLITLYSAIQVSFFGYVSWKGRHIEVKKRK